MTTQSSTPLNENEAVVMEIPDLGFLSCLEDWKTPGFRITPVKQVDLVLVTLMYANDSVLHKQPDGLVMPTKQKGSSFFSLLH